MGGWMGQSVFACYVNRKNDYKLMDDPLYDKIRKTKIQ